ncbi:MAG: insulinase family protein [Candidatus Omnitrophica bacterium]|nr:insulinase family protein [Candidatus Omnitrophota bacterium]
MMYPKTVLPNGLRIVSASMPEMESAAIGIWMAAGGRYESARSCGISHFLEHLIFKGTQTRTTRQIKEAIEGVGGSMNAFTDVEYTCVYARVPVKQLALTLNVLMDMTLHSKLGASDIERERQVILEEIKMYQDMPMQHVQDLLSTLMWPRHPLGMYLAGTPQSVRQIRRKNLVEYRDRFYTPANMVIAAAGPVSHRMLAEQIQKTFSKIRSGKVQRFRRAAGRQSRPRVHCAVKETEQTHLSIGFSAFPRNHPQVHGLNLLHIILGGNMSSRLFHQVREVRGLAYDIGTQVRRYADTGAFTVSAGVEHKKFLKALRVILEELKKIRSNSISREEFERGREFYTGQLSLMLEDTIDHMLWIGESEMALGVIHPLSFVFESLKKTKRSDVTEVARRVLNPSRLNLAVIGPLAPQIQRQAQAMLSWARP